MVGRRASDCKNTTDEDDDNELEESCKKMKPLHLIDDIVVDKHKHERDYEKEFDEQSEQEDEQDEEEGAKPVGEILRASYDGGERKKHFRAFEFDGSRFQLEDPVLVTPEEDKAKPSIVVIKDIFQTKDGELMVKGQRFYRPEEAEKEGGGSWQRHDPRELFYSSHFDDYPADTVMHRCVIHLVPPLKPVPNRKLHPGFIVRKAYEYGGRRIRDLTVKDCKGSLILKGKVEYV